jgi:hypothetical protein
MSSFQGQLKESCLIGGTTIYAAFSIISIQYLWLACQYPGREKLRKKCAGKKNLFDFLTTRKK